MFLWPFPVIDHWNFQNFIGLGLISLFYLLVGCMACSFQVLFVAGMFARDGKPSIYSYYGTIERMPNAFYSRDKTGKGTVLGAPGMKEPWKKD